MRPTQVTTSVGHVVELPKPDPCAHAFHLGFMPLCSGDRMGGPIYSGQWHAHADERAVFEAGWSGLSAPSHVTETGRRMGR